MNHGQMAVRCDFSVNISVVTLPGKPGKILEFKKWSGKPGNLKK